MTFIFKEETPKNIDNLKKKWQRLKVTQPCDFKLSKNWGNGNAHNLSTFFGDLCCNDLVYEVQNASFLRLQSFGQKLNFLKKQKVI